MPSDLSQLRATLAKLERGTQPRSLGLFSLGLAEMDQTLGGGLSPGALHEVFAAAAADGTAAAGYGLGLALRAAGGRAIVWARQDFSCTETGWLYGPGLLAFGLDPRSLVLVRAPDAVGVLRAAAEAARCPALGAVLIEIWGKPPVLDLTATRRLALAAGSATLLLIRIGALPMPSAAMTRWQVAAAPSRPLEANAPGPPAFAVTLLRHRAGIAGCTWHVEWNRDRQIFEERRLLPESAPLSRPVVPISAHRSAAADAGPIPLRNAQ